jgi:hypothetical protein
MSREKERIAIDRALNDLGETSAQVAQTLRTKGASKVGLWGLVRVPYSIT